ncbi:MAG: CRISPR-associated exonuclease Cas4 [Pyrinomonadaceae bacterium]|jgi:CRISPR-associated exonuclease Cas4|nr:CRISPR-associated exonuclease Cas4 [Pyrinomonadaceae bacterium]
MAINFLSLIFVLLVAVAAVAWLAAQRGARRAGLPAGRVIYNDTGAPVGRIAPVRLNARGERQEKPLLSHRHGLVGRPDYLVETDEGVVPVEAKSTKCPADGVPYESHVMQLACYCLLVEETTGASVPFGVIRYRDRELRVDYTDELREALLALLGEMREARVASDVHRSHDERARCAACSYRELCDESLAD